MTALISVTSFSLTNQNQEEVGPTISILSRVPEEETDSSCHWQTSNLQSNIEEDGFVT